MKIKPTQFEFEKWISCVPQDGDLIFLTEKNREILKGEPFPVLTQEQVKAKGLAMWALNYRSWYGYVLNQADYCVWLPKGVLEKFPESLKAQILEEQIRLNVPTIIESRWITSLVWAGLSKEQKIHAMQLWTVKNEIQEYESVDLNDLPVSVKTELERIGYDKLLNQFSAFSGPNCFAATAGAIVTENRISVYNQWMHWPKCEQYLLEHNFKVITSSTPQLGDVLVFTRDNNPIHASYFLGEGYYFEKPGQDFYEPYRVGLFRNWKSDWPESNLAIWRKV